MWGGKCEVRWSEVVMVVVVVIVVGQAQQHNNQGAICNKLHQGVFIFFPPFF